MFCPHCGTNLKDGARFCTSCGQPVNAPAAEQPVPPQPQQQTWQPQPQQPQPQPQQPQQQTWQPQQQGWQQPQQPAWGQQQGWQQPQQPVPPVKTVNKSRRLAAILIPIGAVAVIAALVAVFFTPISNFFRRTFSSPESYYQYVEKREAERLAEDASDYYDTFVPESGKISGNSYEMELSVGLEDAGKQMLQALGTDMDLSWFKDATLRINGAVDEKTSAAELELSLNGTSVLTADGVLDRETAEMFERIPLISSTYFRIALEDYLPPQASMVPGGMGGLLSPEQEEQMQKLIDAFPKDKEVRSLLKKYTGIVSEQIDKVEKDTQTISAEGVSQECTKLTATIDGATMKKIVKAVGEELLRDKKVKELVIRIASAGAELSGETDADYGEDAYEQFTDGVRDMMENADQTLDDSEGFIENVVFVNKQGEVVGRVITANDNGFAFEYLRPQDGDKFGLRLHVVGNEQDLSFIGSGTDIGGTISGTFKASMDEGELFTVEVKDYDSRELKNGNVKGSFKLLPSQRLLGQLPMQIPQLGLQLEIDASSSEANLVLTLMQGENPYAKLSARIKTGSGSPQVRKPSDAVDMEQWMQTADPNRVVEAFVEKLKQAGVPEQLLDTMMGMLSGGNDYYEYD